MVFCAIAFFFSIAFCFHGLLFSWPFTPWPFAPWPFFYGLFSSFFRVLSVPEYENGKVSLFFDPNPIPNLPELRKSWALHQYLSPTFNRHLVLYLTNKYIGVYRMLLCGAWNKWMCGWCRGHHIVVVVVIFLYIGWNAGFAYTPRTFLGVTS